ncbi:AAA family ATPase [Arthrobacter sp. ATA002]|uniref:AAA family ATPase n=1 Tax=Arthrobacter sp. ATA002 TaxID=2991715 RepID=UPI0022A71A46|nr:AAA family ATPase [Arthrobacter sp. ATA002]WAP51845.1 AAA family ATPase [Arthrobacter sp. ATA002]
MNDDVLASLRRAVEASPEDAALRLHVAEMLLAAGRHTETIGEVNAVLQREPAHPAALELLGRTVAALTSASGTAASGTGSAEPVESDPAVEPEPVEPDPAVEPEPVEPDPAVEPADPAAAAFDWTRAESEVGSDVPPPFLPEPQLAAGEGGEGVAPLEPEAPAVTLKDVGGLDAVKKRLNESFMQPMKNAELAKAFGKSLRGGLLLYGPPGCGKTFLARAVAGELGAVFMSVTMTDILDPYHGVTEKNMKAVFDSARAHSPTVLFLDEVDAIGMKRSGLGHHAMIRQMVNQLLIEMDSMAGNNDGLYLLAATNHPWDLDEALLRPGRLDRTLLVTPPDFEARRTILEYHLRDRPLAGIDLAGIASRTEMFSGADLAHICVTAAEKAMTESIQANRICPITMTHINAALDEIGPSTLAWLESSRNVVKFSNEHGRYNDLAEYLRQRSML